MRNKLFVAVHRDGKLTLVNHRKLMRWARDCCSHILPLWTGELDKQLIHALKIAEQWEKGIARTGEAMRASAAAHASAREAPDEISRSIARSIGHAVATAHMADHSLGAALYALKAVGLAGGSTNEEREWQKKQLQHLPAKLTQLVLITLNEKEKGLKIL